MDQWLDSPHIDALLGELQSIVLKKPYTPAFRVSSLPFCPIYALYEDFHKQAAYPYSMGFYTKIGTAIHELFQDFLPHHPTLQVFGNWQCKECGKKLHHKFNTQAKKWYDKRITKQHSCWSHVEYKELELKWKNLSGHTDMLVRLKNKWYLLDFKTTSSKLWTNTAATLKSREFPSKKYYEQIESYAALLYALYKIKIDYIVIVYVGRDGLKVKNKYSIRGFQKRFTKKRYQQRIQRLEFFNSHFEKYTAYKAKPNKAKRKELIKIRPCHDAISYEQKMGIKFDFSPCPCWQDYTCRTDAGVDRFLKDVALLVKDK